MPKLTKLEIVQRALSAIDSDEVNAISDTVEAEQVSLLVDQVYERVLHDFPWYNIKELGQLEVTTTAHQMKIPDVVMGVDWIRYNKKDLIKIEPKEMVTLLDGRDTTQSDVDSNGAKNDQDPTQWSSYDDENIIFDAYDGSLVSALSECMFAIEPSKMTLDTDKPDLPARFHSVLVDGVIADAFITLKGDIQSYGVYSNKFKRGIIDMKRWARKINEDPSFYGDSYGRKWGRVS